MNKSKALLESFNESKNEGYTDTDVLKLIDDETKSKFEKLLGCKINDDKFQEIFEIVDFYNNAKKNHLNRLRAINTGGRW